MCLTKQEHLERRSMGINLSSASRNVLVNQGGGKGILISEEKAFTLATMMPDTVCYSPKTCNCSSYEQSETSATLITGYHYGSGGDAALVLRKAEANQNTVCYPINTMVATRGGKDDMRTTFGVGEQDDPQFTISAAHCHAVCYSVENHPNDSRVRIRDDGTVQTLSARCGTGGAIPHAHSYVATQFAGYKETLPTLRASGGDLGGGSEGLIVYESLSNQNRSAVRQQSSRVVHRSRRIQRHAAGDREESR